MAEQRSELTEDLAESQIDVKSDKELPYIVLDAPMGGKVYLIGTAHFSHESQREVAELITRIQPNRVVLELCSSRVNILKYDEETLMRENKEMDNSKIIKLMKEVNINQYK